MPAGLRECECGLVFTLKKAEHDESADIESQILSEPETLDVKDWAFSRHYKKDDPAAPNTLRVTYFTAGDLGRTVEEWVCLNHEGFAGRKASDWWALHSSEHLDDMAEMLNSDRVAAAMEIESLGFVRMPKQITVVRNGRWWRVTGRVNGELRAKVAEEELPF